MSSTFERKKTKYELCSLKYHNNVSLTVTTLSFTEMMISNNYKKLPKPKHIVCIIGECKLVSEILLLISHNAKRLEDLRTFTFLLPSAFQSKLKDDDFNSNEWVITSLLSMYD